VAFCAKRLAAAMARTVWALERHGEPGFLEIDLVGHEGGDPASEFAYSLCATDMASGWT
jgi:hypothetical protein